MPIGGTIDYEDNVGFIDFRFIIGYSRRSSNMLYLFFRTINIIEGKPVVIEKFKPKIRHFVTCQKLAQIHRNASHDMILIWVSSTIPVSIASTNVDNQHCTVSKAREHHISLLRTHSPLPTWPTSCSKKNSSRK